MPVVEGMNITKPLTLTLALAALAPATAVAAPNLPVPGDPAYQVPAGQVEHTVVRTEVSGANAVPSKIRHELWLSRDRARSVVTNLVTGKITAETTANRTEVRTWSAEAGRMTVRATPSPRWGLPFNAGSFDAAVQRAYVDQGITQVVGEKTVAGRRALVTQSVRGKWRTDEPNSVTTAVVDAETFDLIERTSELPGAFKQTEVYEVREMLPADSPQARMSMTKRKNVPVKRVGPRRR
jgi:hypothetical protein